VRANPIDRAQRAEDKWAKIIDDFAGLMQPPREPALDDVFNAAARKNGASHSIVPTMRDRPTSKSPKQVTATSARKQI
jgi:hypothetical protein